MKIVSLIKTHRNVLLYGVIGVSAMVVDVGFFLLFYNVFAIPPSVATLFSVSIAMVYAFILNARYNFKTKDLMRSRFLSYAVVSLFGMLASAVIIEALVYLNVDANIAKIVSLPPIVVLQYIFNKTFTFKTIA